MVNSNENIFLGITSLLPQFCSHLQSIQYYKISINTDGCEYVGMASDSYLRFLSKSSGNKLAVMGMDYELFHINDGQQRKFYLKTTNTYPYYGKNAILSLSFF